MIPHVRLVALLLFVSGLCALVFQTAWLREFRLIFGASTPASAAVLAIFMGGLGLGNAVLGRRADSVRNPLRLYGGLEIGISLMCGLSPLLVQLVRAIYIAIGGQETLGLAGASIVRLGLSTLVIGVPTFLMGGTLPAAARAVTQPADLGRRDVGLLYGLNTLGAVAGALLSTFFLLEMLGTRATLWAACAVNLLNALAAWKLAERFTPLAAAQPVADQDAPSSPKPAARKKPDKKHRDTASTIDQPLITPPLAAGAGYPPAVLYLSAGLVGFAFFLMELVWYRMLGPILGGSTFTFGLILAVALAGIGIGGAIYPLVFRDRQPTLRSFALTLAWEALAIALPFALGDRVAVLALVLRTLAVYGFFGQALGWLAITLIVVFPAALISGIQFPVLIALIGQGNRDVGKQLGQAFGWNTVGAIAGSLAGGFGLISLLSATGVWQVVVLLLGAFAVAVLLADYRRTRQAGRLLMPLGVVAVAAICLAALGPTDVWRHSGIGAGRAVLMGPSQNDLRAFMNSSRRHIVSQTDGRESSVAISAQNGISFIVNGKSDGNAVSDAGTQMMLTVLGALLHQDPRDGLVIGLGTGESAGWLASLPAIERVDVVELEPAILDVARICGPMNHNVLDHPKVHVTLNDAREVLQTTRRKYDLIASEPSNPYRTGVSSLYTREFYLSARERLKPGGIFIQWLQGYEIDLPTIRTVLCTLSEVFPNVEIWETNPADLVLVCSVEPLEYSAADLRQRMAEPAMRHALRVAWRTRTLEGVLAHLVADRRYARAVAERGEAAINTDDRNILEYNFARTVGRQGGFTITGLRTEALAAEMFRPPRLESQVNWELVEDCRIAYYALIGESPLPPDLFQGDRAKRTRAISTLLLEANAAGMIREWESQSKAAPHDLPETQALALAYADAGDARAVKLIDDLRPDTPLEALALEGILAARQDRPAEATERFCRLFVNLRDDATPTRRIVEHSLLVASQVGEGHKEHLRPLYEALDQPFSVLLFDERRREILCHLGERLGGREFKDAMLGLEPHPPWDKRILQMRVRAYSQPQHPLLARAQRDLDEIYRLLPEAAVLMPTEKAVREIGTLAAPRNDTTQPTAPAIPRAQTSSAGERGGSGD